MSSNVVSFVEESCWDGETFRSIRREVVFVVAGHAIRSGQVVRHEFRSDFGLWYDFDDTVLLSILQEERPDVDWGRFVYHKKMDHSGIHIIDAESDKVVGSIYPRGRTRQRLLGEEGGVNVTPIAKGREYREKRRVAAEEQGAGEDGGSD